jgi:cobyrinic acid a,c-diamide synthase
MHAIVVAGTHSGAGKTTVTLGLIAALRRRGLAVQPFKVGPDFIDPAHHGPAAGRVAHNLDGWMLSREANLELFADHAAEADVAVIEGMMGLYDGADPGSNAGSTAEMAGWVGAPVLLVIDASALARSAAALVQGYATFDPGSRVIGVLANRVGSAAHAELIAMALQDGPPLLGWLPDDSSLAMPERHLGLVLPGADADRRIERIADALEPNLDTGRLLALSELPRPAASASPRRAPSAPRVRIGVARDEAFSFYYEDNLDRLVSAGAELIEFSPLHGRLPQALDGLYVGGGYPELHAAALAANTQVLDDIRALAAAGRPVYGECGGLIYLGERIEVDGDSYPLCGALPLATRFPARLEIGYAEIDIDDGGPFKSARPVRGHWFHKAELTDVDPAVQLRYTVRLVRSGERLREGYSVRRVLGSWLHLHFRSCPDLAPAFVDACIAPRDPAGA